MHQNRGNIDSTLQNFSEMSAKLNESADKVDGVLTAAKSFLARPGTKGAVDRIGEAAISIKKLADDIDSRMKDIAAGLSRFTNTGLREYEALAVEGRRTIQDVDGVVRSLGRNPSQVIFGSNPRCLNITAGNDGALGGWIAGSIEICRCEHRSRLRFPRARAGPLRPVRSYRGEPPPAHARPSAFRVGQATATADLDSDHFLVRESQTLATLAGARWPEPLPALFRARLAESFQNAGLARSIDGPAANANYEVDLDIRAFELDAQSKEVHVDIAAWIVSLGSGRIMADQIFTLRIPVTSTDAANVAAAMDQAASTVMTDIVAFVARKL